jgi:hypothetical protein
MLIMVIVDGLGTAETVAIAQFVPATGGADEPLSNQPKLP